MGAFLLQMNHPMQVKPATTEPKLTPVGKPTEEMTIALMNTLHIQCMYPTLSFIYVHTNTHAEERRLFVGMLNRDFTEEDVMAMFSTYGHVEDVSILRNKEGVSKGVYVSLQCP